MTLDEAIKHCLEVVEQNETQADKWQEEGGEQWGKTIACRECAADHRQLAEWLRELKERRSGGWIRCKDKMPEDNTSVLFAYVSENGIKSVHYGYHQTLKGLGSSWAKPSGGWQYCDDDVTHWMPIPEPPKDGDTNG